MGFKRGRAWVLISLLVFSIIISSVLVSAWRPDFLKTKAYYNKEIKQLQDQITNLQKKYPDTSVKTGVWGFRTTVAEQITKLETKISALEKARDAKFSGAGISSASGVNIGPPPKWWEDLKDDKLHPKLAPFIRDWESGRVSCEIIKLFLLILVILLIFSSFIFVDFPPGYILKTLVSIALGLMITWLVTTGEVCAMLAGYRAVGISLMIFFPILVLTFFSFIVAYKMKNPFGLMAQRIMWLVYSMFLLLRTSAYFLSMIGVGSESDGILMTLTKQAAKLAWDAAVGATPTENTGDFFIIGIIHFIVALAVLWIFVFRNQDFLKYIYEKRMEAEVLSEKEKFKRARAARDVYAGALGGKDE